MGIYHEQVSRAALHTGNSNVLTTIPRFNGNLQELYQVNLEEKRAASNVSSVASPSPFAGLAGSSEIQPDAIRKFSDAPETNFDI